MGFMAKVAQTGMLTASLYRHDSAPQSQDQSYQDAGVG